MQLANCGQWLEFHQRGLESLCNLYNNNNKTRRQSNIFKKIYMKAHKTTNSMIKWKQFQSNFGLRVRIYQIFWNHVRFLGDLLLLNLSFLPLLSIAILLKLNSHMRSFLIEMKELYQQHMRSLEILGIILHIKGLETICSMQLNLSRRIYWK